VLQQFVHGDEIAERFRHFGAVDAEEAVVHPKAHEWPTVMRRLALRELVLVMRKDQIDAAAMDVEGLAEMRLAHRRAFDVPARPAAAPRAVPARLLRRRRLPQHKIAGVLLVGRDLDAGAGDQLVAAAPGQPAVAGPRRYPE